MGVVKTYGYYDGVQISPHFNSNEFRCKCGTPHEILIDDELVENLEGIHKAFNCRSIIINSGYRCPAHDRKFGTGRGMHTQGKAADIVCRYQDNKIINSKLVCCKAQDVGFKGIANIDSTYTATHVDTRTNKWFSDETKGASFTVDDFYEYFDDVVMSKPSSEPIKYFTKEEIQVQIKNLKTQRDAIDKMISDLEEKIK